MYSNFSYSIPELIIENVSGKSFADFMKAEVFEPLGMMHTSVGMARSMKHYTATKYGSNNTPIPHLYFVPAAAGGIYSSAHDLIVYGMFHLGNHSPNQKQILKDETLTAMHTDKERNLQSAIMSLGWGSVNLEGGPDWVLSNGSIGGATSMLSLVPSANLAVVCLTNVTSARAGARITDQIAIEITDALLPKFAEKAEAFMKRYELANTFEVYKPTSQFIGQWDGEIKTFEAGVPIRIVFHDNGMVTVRLDRRPEVSLGNVSTKYGELKGDFEGMLPYTEGSNHEQAIGVHVKVKDDEMYGVAAAKYEKTQGVLMVPYYICLNRK